MRGGGAWGAGWGCWSREEARGAKKNDYVMHFFLDFSENLWPNTAILAHEGRLLETILKAERGVAFRGLRLVTARLGRLGTPPARHYDLAARSSLHGSGGNAGDGSAAPGPKSPRWSAERRASLRL